MSSQRGPGRGAGLPAGPGAGRGVGAWVLRLLVVAGLAVDVVVHLHLAAGYDLNTAVVSEGALFRVEAALAALAAVLVLVTRWRVGVVLALLVAAGGVVAVLVYQYVDVGAVGPFPDMYEPISYPEKTYSLLAEAVAAVAALALLTLSATRRARGVPVHGRV
jgi:hypothetical protein